MNWDNVLKAIYLMIIGMGIVFLSLIILMEFIKLISWLEKVVRKLTQKAATPTTAVQTTTEDSNGLSPEEVAVIAAAAAEALSADVEIHHIKLLHNENQDNWSRMGWMDIMRSHNLPSPVK